MARTAKDKMQTGYWWDSLKTDTSCITVKKEIAKWDSPVQDKLSCGPAGSSRRVS